MVARICASYDRDLAREVVEDACFAIWRALPNYRADASLKTFVAGIAQFRAISQVAQRDAERLAGSAACTSSRSGAAAGPAAT